MLIEFSVENFGSIQTRQTLSALSDNRPQNLRASLIESCLSRPARGVRLLPTIAIYGANASGKSMLLKALNQLQMWVLHGITWPRPADNIEINQFALTSHPEPNTTWCVTFEAGNTAYRYEVTASKDRVISEKLYEQLKTTSELIFGREFDAETNDYIWDSKGRSEYLQNQLLGKARANNLFLTVAAEFNDQNLLPAFNWFSAIAVFSRHVDRDQWGKSFTSFMAHENPDWKHSILDFLKFADLGVQDMNVKPIIPKDYDKRQSRPAVIDTELNYEVKLKHSGDGGSLFDIKYENESDGTRQLFGLAGPILDSLMKGRCLFIDELDTSLHPSITAMIIDYWHHAVSMGQRAQLVFTTHDVSLLQPERFRRDQVVFIEKDDSGASEIYSLNDFEKKNNESLLRGYLQGRYGAIPKTPLTYRDLTPSFESISE